MVGSNRRQTGLLVLHACRGAGQGTRQATSNRPGLRLTSAGLEGCTSHGVCSTLAGKGFWLACRAVPRQGRGQLVSKQLARAIGASNWREQLARAIGARAERATRKGLEAEAGSRAGAMPAAAGSFVRQFFMTAQAGSAGWQYGLAVQAGRLTFASSTWWRSMPTSRGSSASACEGGWRRWGRGVSGGASRGRRGRQGPTEGQPWTGVQCRSMQFI